MPSFPTFGLPPGPPPTGLPAQQFGGAPPQAPPMSDSTLAALLGPGEAAAAQKQQQMQMQMQQQMQQPGPPPPGAPGAPGSDEARRNEEERSSRRTRESKAQNEKREKMAEAEAKKCHLHKKPKNGCKFCMKHQELIEAATKKDEEHGDKGRDRRRHGRRPDRAISEDPGERRGPLELANSKTFGFSGLLQTHVVECAHFKSLLTLETFDQLVDETYQFANSVEPYMANSGTLPSALFCCLYRFFTMGLDGHQLRRLLENQESPYIRCCGFLYVRFGLPHDQLITWLGEYILDDEEFKPAPESEWKTSIGEYVATLMSQDKYYNTVLPRLPMVTKRQVEEILAPLGQNRKRMQANKHALGSFREAGLKVECNIGGDWIGGKIIELEEDQPTRPKVRVRLEDGSEEYIHLGKVIIAEGRSRRSGRSRSRSPGGGKTDWTRDKGRSDKELIDEMRSKEREKAVCSSGKDYARKPVGYKAACALPREQGQASYRLMEEETFVPMNRGKRGRSPSPEQQNFARNKQQSAEHQARMQQLFEKYGNQKSAAQAGGNDDGVDRPDVMRLG